MDEGNNFLHGQGALLMPTNDFLPLASAFNTDLLEHRGAAHHAETDHAEAVESWDSVWIDLGGEG